MQHVFTCLHCQAFSQIKTAKKSTVISNGELSNETQLTKACESAGFVRRVSIGMHYKTVHDLNNGGFEGKTGARREYAKPREDKSFRDHCMDRCTPKLVHFFKSKLHVVLTYTESKHNGSTSWVYISRDTNRYVKELRYNDPDYSPESHELANQMSTEETRASQRETRSNLMSDHYEDFIPIHL